MVQGAQRSNYHGCIRWHCSSVSQIPPSGKREQRRIDASYFVIKLQCDVNDLDHNPPLIVPDLTSVSHWYPCDDLKPADRGIACCQELDDNRCNRMAGSIGPGGQELTQRSELRVVGHPGKWNHVPHIGQPRDIQNQPLKSQAKSGVGDGSVATQVPVPPIMFFG